RIYDAERRARIDGTIDNTGTNTETSRTDRYRQYLTRRNRQWEAHGRHAGCAATTSATCCRSLAPCAALTAGCTVNIDDVDAFGDRPQVGAYSGEQNAIGRKNASLSHVSKSLCRCCRRCRREK